MLTYCNNRHKWTTIATTQMTRCNTNLVLLNDTYIWYHLYMVSSIYTTYIIRIMYTMVNSVYKPHTYKSQYQRCLYVCVSHTGLFIIKN